MKRYCAKFNPIKVLKEPMIIKNQQCCFDYPFNENLELTLIIGKHTVKFLNKPLNRTRLQRENDKTNL